MNQAQRWPVAFVAALLFGVGAIALIQAESLAGRAASSGSGKGTLAGGSGLNAGSQGSGVAASATDGPAAMLQLGGDLDGTSDIAHVDGYANQVCQTSSNYRTQYPVPIAGDATKMVGVIESAGEVRIFVNGTLDQTVDFSGGGADVQTLTPIALTTTDYVEVRAAADVGNITNQSTFVLLIEAEGYKSTTLQFSGETFTSGNQWYHFNGDADLSVLTFGGSVGSVGRCPYDGTITRVSIDSFDDAGDSEYELLIDAVVQATITGEQVATVSVSYTAGQNIELRWNGTGSPDPDYTSILVTIEATGATGKETALMKWGGDVTTERYLLVGGIATVSSVATSPTAGLRAFRAPFAGTITAMSHAQQSGAGSWELDVATTITDVVTGSAIGTTSASVSVSAANAIGVRRNATGTDPNDSHIVVLLETDS